MKFSKPLLKPLLLIILLIIAMAFISRIMTSSETLADYAANHPDLQVEETISTGESDTQEASSYEAIMTQAVESTANEDESISPIDEYADSIERIMIAEGFFFEPLPAYIQEEIIGISYPEDATVSMDDLRFLNVLYYDFDHQIQTGELICNKAIAQDLTEIFHDLFKAEYQIEKIKLIDDYQGDDHLSMLDNNTSCFNYRVVDGTTKLSKHAYGLAIDINPFYNPYVTYENGAEKVSPEGSEPYADRTQAFPYKIDENDLCYKLFTAHGFTWGGNWNSSKDYQHFQKAE